ncbi:uncharacterized protein LOC105835315 [Monomorium pharaonis]|uniref:uncharacterized protein LOC105835315 n=1 Tax=Monomorium pharaonis TaxID=307658 RepID=UPI00102E11DA|nr:uncharacterized protein LOC105835315 [Monomorium pharaonis]
MSYMKTLPLLDGTKLIVIEEGLDATHATALIAGWIHVWKEKNSDHSIELLSFSEPKAWYDSGPEPLTSTNTNLHDYFTVDTTKNAEKRDLENLDRALNLELKPQTTVVVNCLSTLILYVGLQKTLWFIDKLSKRVSQLICIYRRDFIDKVPAIETFGTTYVKLEKFVGIIPTNSLVYNAMFTHRKLSGSVICQTEVIKQDIESYQINAEKITVPSICKTEPIKIESSFRIEMSAQEMAQRDKTPLPYTLNATSTSRILYQPEDVDDIDEEDPDDDLCI